MPKLSVIIPTYRRPEILAQCMGHLERQTVVADLEVIVVSDGHDEKASEVLGRPWLVDTRFFEINKSHQGIARNKGVSEASGQYVLFIGDDIFLAPDACEAHLKMHEKSGKLNVESGKYSSFAVLGFTTWDPACGITPVMQWLETSGWQFGYLALDHRRATGSGPMIDPSVQHRYSYTSHISLPLEIAKKYPFRTDVHLYGWEDIEWGMRLRSAGVRLMYEPDAKALHHHHLELEASLKRMEILGRSAVEISKVVPEFDRVPRGWKLWAYKILSMLPTMAGKHRRAFLNGIIEGDAT